MTSRQKAEALGRYRLLCSLIDSRTGELAGWRDRAERITSVVSDMPRGGGGGDRLQAAVEHIVLLEQELAAQIAAARRERGRIERAIGKVGDGQLRALLEMRYLGGLPFSAIAARMGFSNQWVFELHARALEAVELEGALRAARADG